MNAWLAAATARPTSSGPPAATAAYGWLVTGSATSKVAPSALGTCAPAMKCSSLAGSPAGVLVTAGPDPRTRPGIPEAPGLGEREKAVDALAGGDPFGDEFFLAFLLAGLGQQFGGVARGQDDHAVGVADQDVAGLDRHAGAGHGDAGLPRNVPAAEDGRVDGGVVDRDLQSGQGGAVPDRAVGDDAGRTAYLGAQGQDVADRARRLVAAGLDDEDLVRPDGLDRPALRVHPPAVARGQVLAQRQVADGPGVAGHLLFRAGGAQAVQGEAVQAAFARDRGQRGRGDLAQRRQDLLLALRGLVPGAVGGIAFGVVGAGHGAGGAQAVAGLDDGAAQPAG